MSTFALFLFHIFQFGSGKRSQMNQSDNRHDSEGSGDINAMGGDISV